MNIIKLKLYLRRLRKAIKMAVKRDVNNMVLPSTKGML